METFVIYSTTTEEIIWSGTVDRDELPDNGVTKFEQITETLDGNSDLSIFYLSKQKLPKKREYKVKNGKLKKQDKDWKPQREIYEDQILAKSRRLAIDSLIADDIGFPIDYE